VLAIVSLPSVDSSSYHHDVYNKTIIPRFDKFIEIINSQENKMIDIKMRRSKNTTTDFHNGNLFSINKRDLLTVSAPTK
jgi:hypothetical protein